MTRRSRTGHRKDQTKGDTDGTDAAGPGAARAGAGVCLKMGTVVSEPELIDRLARERAAGRTIAFANGCFDLLHVGHVRYLQGAAAEGDVLVVAANDDRPVAALKGEGGPLLSAADRAELVAGLRGVDYVVVFGEPDVERLLRLL